LLSRLATSDQALPAVPLGSAGHPGARQSGRRTVHRRSTGRSEV